MSAQRALYYRLEGEDIVCLLCPQGCHIKEAELGACGVRKARSRELISLNYGRLGSVAMDPIEKKPLYHFYPGWKILSIGTFGCNLHCAHCQNWTLARGNPDSDWREITPPVLEQALAASSPREKLGVAYTYNEPGVWYEFVLESARYLHEKGYKNVLVTNGYLNPEPLAELLPFIDAMNIDVKAFEESFYRRYCRGKGLKEVLRTVEQALPVCHVELTYLVINTINDSPAEISGFIDWVASLGADIPVHFSRYFPQYRLEISATPLPVMERVWESAAGKLPYVYLGNVGDENRSATYCPSCGAALIKRTGLGVHSAGLQGKRCKNCGCTIRLEGSMFS